MDFTLWGDVTYLTDTHVLVNTNNMTYHVTIYDDYTLVKLMVGKRLMFTFKGIMMDRSDLSTFRRELNNHTYYFESGNLIVKKLTRICKFLTKVNVSPFLVSNIITMDLETRNIDGTLTPYCVSIYDGKELKSFYLSDFDNSELMLKESILYLMKRKYTGHRVYLHNFSHFDGIFLLRILSSMSSDLAPIIRDSRIIDLKFKHGKYTIYFRDSYLLLPSYLRKLAISFNVENKGIFPYTFVNNVDIPLNYKGIVPAFDYFSNITIEEYNEYCKEFQGKMWV